MLYGNPLLESRVPTIDNIYLSYDFVEHYYVCTFLQKEIKKCYKRFHYIRGSKSKELAKDTSYV